VKLVATHPKATKSYDKESYQEAVGFLIGNESNGLREQILNLAEERVQIPMKGQVESLNVAIATGILVYEAYRQRR
jgi:TrmH family RNA methyltransferase